MEDSTSSKSDGDGSDQEDGIGGMGMAEREREPKLRQVEDDELGMVSSHTLIGRISRHNDSFNSHRHHHEHQMHAASWMTHALSSLLIKPIKKDLARPLLENI
ncbi:GL13302 [Drosophila persimilis]|uniref:GL13302 n=1 Tax=Drosophila persimilis TaxID=7234 RepID=B4HDC6_DROPE|nr:GL13302 [Drosophila persimilis]